MEDLLKCQDIEEVKIILNKRKKDNYDRLLNIPENRDFVFSQIDVYNFMEQSIRHHEIEIENLKKQKDLIGKRIYQMTNLYVKDIKELSHMK